MKQTAYNAKTFFLFIAFALLTSHVGSYSQAFGQGEPQFKVGDRVEVDTLMSSNPNTSKSWRKGTIKEVVLDGMMYVIKLDATGPSSRPQEISIPIRFPEKWVRPLKESARTDDKSKSGPAERQGDSEVTGKARSKSTESDKEKSGTNATAKTKPSKKPSGCGPSTELYQAMIRENKEFQYKQNYDRVEVTFETFKIGKAFKWTNPYGRAINATAYPVRARYRVEVWGGLNGDINHVWEYDQLIHFYVDTHKECTFDTVEGSGGKMIR
jgi:hypothetical protein